MNSISKKSGRTQTLAVFLLLIGLTAGCNKTPVGQDDNIPYFAQMEAQTTLRMIYLKQVAYHEEHGVYWRTTGSASATHPDGFAELGIIIMPSARYTYTIMSGWTSLDFTATASCCIFNDVWYYDGWTIDQYGDLRHVMYGPVG
jgi:hypothetical protein